MKQVLSNPTINENLTPVTYNFSATGASGTVTGTAVNTLLQGQSIILGIGGASAGGYTKNGEYFVIPVGTTSFRIAATKADALAGNPILTASGNAGSGVVYPNYKVGGTLYVGTSGNVNIRGIGVPEGGGTSSFSLCKNVSDGSEIPFMIGDLSASGTTASDFVIWSN